MRLPATLSACAMLVLAIAPVSGLGPAPAPEGLPTSLGQAIVGFEPGAVASLDLERGTLAGLPVRALVPAGDFVVVAASDLRTVRAAVAGLPAVAYVEDDAPVRSLAVPNDPSYGSQYGPGQMGFPTAWGQAGYGSSAVKVAVIDSGLHKTHADFQPARILQGHDYVNGDTNPNDDCGHGTHVTGTVAATTDNGVGVAGMSQATILPLKALGAVGGILGVQCTGSTSGVAQAILDASAQGAKVISMSIGGGSSTTLQNAVNSAWNNGVLLVAAAGNDGASNSIDFPAAYGNVIAVGALTASKARASYSDMGPQLDVMAPGSGVLSTYNNGGYTTLDGTSMATPHVSGALALALSCAPTATNVQVRNALASTAEDLGAAGFDNTYGNGLARADLLVASLCAGGPANQPPTASFTASTAGLTASVDASGSGDSDGTLASYAWAFGDGSTGSGVTASRSYAAAGTYTVTLTVTDDDGATASTTRSVTVSSGGGGADPDPATPNLQSGASQSVAIAANQEKFYKIEVPAGKAQLKVEMTGPACGLLSCSLDADLYTRLGLKPTDATYDCRPFLNGNAETCTHANPGAGWWYVRVDGFSGSGTVTLKATVT